MRSDEIITTLRSVKLAPQFQGNELRNRVEFRDELRRVRAVPGFEAHVAQLLKHVDDGDSDIVVYKDQNIAVNIQNNTNELRIRVHVALEILSAWYGNDEKETVYVGMPTTALQDPASFAKAFEEIVMGIDDLTRRVTGLGMRVHGVRAGSAWIQLLMEVGPHVAEGLATVSPFAFIMGFIRFLFWCRAKQAHVEAEEARTAGLKNHEAYMAGLRGVNTELTRNAAAALIEQYQTSATREAANENVGFMVNLINTLQGHIDSGARIAVTANASRAVKRELPEEAGGYLPAIGADDLPVVQRALPPGSDEGKDE